MTRNEYIAQTAMLIFANNGEISHEIAVLGGKMLADTLEYKGCAPWQDAPPIKRTGVGEYTVDLTQAVDTHPIQFGLPTRREITAADVQPGAIFADSGYGQSARTVVDVNAGIAIIQRAEDPIGETYSVFVHEFIENRNEHNATVTPPTA